MRSNRRGVFPVGLHIYRPTSQPLCCRQTKAGSLRRTMVQVKVKILTGKLPCGPEVKVDIEESTPMYVVKAKLEALTGVPIEHQKVMLAGIGQMVMADKRTNIGFSHCGSTNSLYFGLLEVPPAPGATPAAARK